MVVSFFLFFFFFNDTATTEIYTLSLHDALPIASHVVLVDISPGPLEYCRRRFGRSEEHTSELQSRPHLVCRLLLEKKNANLPISARRECLQENQLPKEDLLEFEVIVEELLPNATFRVQLFFFFNDTATTEIYTLSLHDALPI